MKNFSRAELAAILGLLAIFGLLAAPAIARNNSDVDLAACFNNNRRLIQAWHTFTVDHNEQMPSTYYYRPDSQPRPIAGPNADTNIARYHPWAQGNMDWNSTPSNTNSTYLLSTNYASLAVYLNDRNVFKCPADRFLSPLQRNLRHLERVRSVAAGVTMGFAPPSQDVGVFGGNYYGLKKTSEIVNPAPALAFVFMEEHPDSLNDIAFLSPAGSTNSLYWMDYPASHHNGAATISFADGHLESQRWLGPVRTNIVRYNFTAPSGDSRADMRWIHDRTPKKP